MSTNPSDTSPNLQKSFLFSKGQKLALLLCNAIPLMMIIVLGTLLYFPWTTMGGRLTAAVAMLYLFPPLLARLFLTLYPLKTTHIGIPSGDYFIWWIILNLQVIFNRLPALEELLRLIPGVYSGWLRLWGSRIGSLIYWAPGMNILDRSFLEFGNGIVFGAGVKLNPHVIAKDKDGNLQLLLAPVRIGDRAVIGGYSLLTAGTHIACEEVTRAFLISPPFSHWANGRRTEKNPSAQEPETVQS
jgi:hypothetical protein